MTSFNFSEWMLHPLREMFHSNQTNMLLVWTLTSLVTFYTAFLLMVCTAKGRRLSTLILGSVSFLTLYSHIFALTEPRWFLAEDADMDGSFHLHNRSFIETTAHLSVTLGLRSFKVTYTSTTDQHFNYDEEFTYKHESLREESLKRGLPNHIIAVAEYLCVENKTGLFAFPRLVAWLLWRRVETFIVASTTLFLLGLVVSFTMPKYLIRSLMLNAFTMLFTVVYLYVSSGAGCYSTNLTIYVEGRPLTFTPGRTFYLFLAAGVVNLATAMGIAGIGKAGIANVTTFLELDYDTPWATKRLEQDSRERRELAEERGGGGGLFQRGSNLKSSFIRVRNSIRAVWAFKQGLNNKESVESSELKDVGTNATNFSA